MTEWTVDKRHSIVLHIKIEPPYGSEIPARSRQPARKPWTLPSHNSIVPPTQANPPAKFSVAFFMVFLPLFKLAILFSPQSLGLAGEGRLAHIPYPGGSSNLDRPRACRTSLSFFRAARAVGEPPCEGGAVGEPPQASCPGIVPATGGSTVLRASSPLNKVIWQCGQAQFQGFWACRPVQTTTFSTGC